MSWFWGGNNSKGSDDPTKDLSPELKEFLDKNQPQSYTPSTPSRVSASLPEQPAAFSQSLPVSEATQVDEDRPLPKESLYQDGRYKDLWKTYVPQAERAAMSKNPIDVVTEQRKSRKTGISRAAMENCAFENEMQMKCFDTGDAVQRAKARITMCRSETRAFNRCYQIQSKFLQALGYMSSSVTSDDDAEKIQMHADKLYHQMMDYEATVEDAKQKQLPIPPLTSIFDLHSAAPDVKNLNLPPEVEEKLGLKLVDLAPHERELAMRAALSEARKEFSEQADIKEYKMELDEATMKRQKWVSNIFGEPVGKMLIPSKPADEFDHVKVARQLDDLESTIWKGGFDAQQRREALEKAQIPR